MILLLLFQAFCLVSSSDSSPAVFCDDEIGSYSGNGGQFSLYNTEFPLAPNGASMERFNFYHPCYALTATNNYKNSLFGIQKEGEFMKTVCRRKCAHFLDVGQPTCSERRASPYWSVYMFSMSRRAVKVDCSDWDLPLTEKGIVDGIYLRHNVENYRTAPFKLDNASLAYTDKLYINGYHVSQAIYDSSPAVNMEEELDYFIDHHPELSHITFGNLALNTFEDEVEYIKSKSLMSKFAKAKSLESIAFARVDLTDTETEPSTDMRKIKAVTFKEVKLDRLPNWLEKADLQFLDIFGSITDSVNIDSLNNLPNLEHFVLKGSELTKISKDFLKSSTKLISLTLECNMISSIEEGTFDKFPNLQFLNLAGNRLSNLPDSLFSNLKKLVVLDIKTFEPSRFYNEAIGARINGFDEKSTICPAGLNAGNATILEAIPKVPNPDKIKFLDIRGQTKILQKNKAFLEQFRKVEILNLGKMGLTSLHNISLHKLCNLHDLNVMDNAFSETDWIPEEMFLNVHLEHFRIGSTVNPPVELLRTITDISDVLIAFMRSSMYILNNILSQMYMKSIDPSPCTNDAMNRGIQYGYKSQDENCGERSFKRLIAMEAKRADTKC